MNAPRIRRPFAGRLDFEHGQVELSHGSGGRTMAQLIEELFVAAFHNPWLDQRNDQACLDLPPGRCISPPASFWKPGFHWLTSSALWNPWRRRRGRRG